MSSGGLISTRCFALRNVGFFGSSKRWAFLSIWTFTGDGEARSAPRMDVDIKIATSKPCYFAGETVEGTVTVNVTDSDGTPANGLFLELKGKISSKVVFGNDVRRQSKDITEHVLPLTKFGGHAEFGNHVFPFALVLPVNLPSSMKETCVGGRSCCSIEYSLKGKLKRPGFLNFDTKDKHEIEVFATPKVSGPLPVLAGPDSTAVKTCCCFTKGCMSIGFLADRSVMSHNEVLGITVVARNDSTKPVKELVVELCQDATWTANRMTGTKKRTIASIKVSGSQLGDVWKPAERGSGRGRSVDVSAVRNELEGFLRSGAGVRHELVVPKDCFDTMDSELIVVRHSIEAKLKDPSGVKSPNVCTSVVVQRAGGAVSGGATQPMPVETATPATPPAVGLDA